MGVAQSCECDTKDTPPEIIEAEKVIADLEPFEPQIEHIAQSIEPDQLTVAHRTTSKIRRSLLLERKLHTDTEIMRGASETI